VGRRCRVVRSRTRTPSRRSSAATLRDSVDGGTPKSAAARAKLPRSTTRDRTTRSRSSDIIAVSHESDAISCLPAGLHAPALIVMRMAVLIVLASCNDVLSLDPAHEIPPVDAAIDAPPLCPVGSPIRTVTIAASEETTLIDDGNLQAHGD